jgi:hypothetical protein
MLQNFFCLSLTVEKNKLERLSVASLFGLVFKERDCIQFEEPTRFSHWIG